MAVGGTSGWFPDGSEKPWLDGSTSPSISRGLNFKHLPFCFVSSYAWFLETEGPVVTYLAWWPWSKVYGCVRLSFLLSFFFALFSLLDYFFLRPFLQWLRQDVATMLNNQSHKRTWRKRKKKKKAYYIMRSSGRKALDWLTRSSSGQTRHSYHHHTCIFFWTFFFFTVYLF